MPERGHWWLYGCLLMFLSGTGDVTYIRLLDGLRNRKKWEALFATSGRRPTADRQKKCRGVCQVNFKR